jgi:hypothetical protein
MTKARVMVEEVKKRMADWPPDQPNLVITCGPDEKYSAESIAKSLYTALRPNLDFSVLDMWRAGSDVVIRRKTARLSEEMHKQEKAAKTSNRK